MNTQCPYCGSYEHAENYRIFSCGTPMHDPNLRNQTGLCIDRQVGKEASEGLEKVASALGLRQFMEENIDDGYPELAEACLEKIRDLVAATDGREKLDGSHGAAQLRKLLGIPEGKSLFDDNTLLIAVRDLVVANRKLTSL